MNPALATAILAIAKNTKLVEEARASVAPGETYVLDTLLHVGGGLTVGKDTEAKATYTIPWQALALAALSKLNAATRSELARAALSGREALEAEGVKEEVQAIADDLHKNAPKVPRAGIVKSVATIREVEPLLPPEPALLQEVRG
jgi:hypothetical protein